MNKFLLSVIIFVLIQALVEAFIPAYAYLSRYADYSLAIASVLAMIMMVINGTFMTSRYVSIVKFGLGVLAVGVCFKILHLSGGDQLLTFAWLFFFSAYGIHFSKKHPKMVLDYFKFLTMMSFLLSTVFEMVNVVSEDITDIVELAGFGLFWSTFVLFLIIERKKLWAKKVLTP